MKVWKQARSKKMEVKQVGGDRRRGGEETVLM